MVATTSTKAIYTIFVTGVAKAAKIPSRRSSERVVYILDELQFRLLFLQLLDMAHPSQEGWSRISVHVRSGLICFYVSIVVRLHRPFVFATQTMYAERNQPGESFCERLPAMFRSLARGLALCLPGLRSSHLSRTGRRADLPTIGAPQHDNLIWCLFALTLVDVSVIICCTLQPCALVGTYWLRTNRRWTVC